MGDCFLTVCPCLLQQSTDEGERARRIRSRTIDQSIEDDRQRQRRTVKILLLGSGESGKSTFMKQMRIIHGKDFDDDELQRFKQTVYENIMKGTMTLIDARSKLGVPFADHSNSDSANFIRRFDTNIRLDEPVFLQYVPSLMALWQDAGIQKVYRRRREFRLGDTVSYFLDNLKRIGQPNYVPSLQDILHARKSSKGITEIEFIIRSVPFLFVDVGGHRSQRQMWGRCFDSMRSILFFVASNEFDQFISDEQRQNRLIESTDIFELICNNKALTDVSVILFLNKTDLLAEKIVNTSIADYFPSFTGNPRSLTDVQQFEVSLFDRRRKDRSQLLYHHFTTAVDTENTLMVFRDVRDTILQQNIRSIMPS